MTEYIIEYGRGDAIIAASARIVDSEESAVWEAAEFIETLTGLKETVGGPQTHAAARRSAAHRGTRVSICSSRRWVAVTKRKETIE